MVGFEQRCARPVFLPSVGSIFEHGRVLWTLWPLNLSSWTMTKASPPARTTGTTNMVAILGLLPTLRSRLRWQLLFTDVSVDLTFV